MIDNKQLKNSISTCVTRMRDGYVPRRPDAVLKHPEAPVTGKLKYEALKVDTIKEGVYRVYIDEEISPYMPYTNEPWISPKWHGAKNPNEKWWERFCDELVKEIAVEVGKGDAELRRK